jgi:SAM-dependent methyltransferase
VAGWRSASTLCNDAPKAANAVNGVPEVRSVPIGTDKQLRDVALQIGRDWKHSPYYDTAEQGIDRQWTELIWPFLTDEPRSEIDFSTTVELAAGHGRNSAKLLPLARKLHLVDINIENISFLRRRFRHSQKVQFHLNNGDSLSFLKGDSVSFIYCFDAMVHFDSDVVRSYLREFSRTLIRGGRAFAHHSNYTGNPGGNLHDNPGWRNFMSRELFAHYAYKSGLLVIRQKNVDWKSDGTFIDCFTLLEAH